nr:MAG TPA: hypothetical protein [Caudoviricetes sp.]
MHDRMVGGYEGGWVATTITNLRWDDKSSPLTYLKDESVSSFYIHSYHSDYCSNNFVSC